MKKILHHTFDPKRHLHAYRVRTAIARYEKDSIKIMLEIINWLSTKKIKYQTFDSIGDIFVLEEENDRVEMHLIFGDHILAVENRSIDVSLFDNFIDEEIKDAQLDLEKYMQDQINEVISTLTIEE